MVSYTSSSHNSLGQSGFDCHPHQPQKDGSIGMGIDTKKRQQPHHKQLHALHKTVSKKPPQSSTSASLHLPHSSTQPKVYNVKPIHFRELVQSLTGASSAPSHIQPSPPQRLQQAAPAPAPAPLQLHNNNDYPSYSLHIYSTNAAATNIPLKPSDIAHCASHEKNPLSSATCSGGLTIPEASMGLNLSPSFQSLFSFPLLSPTQNLFQHNGL